MGTGFVVDFWWEGLSGGSKFPVNTFCNDPKRWVANLKGELTDWCGAGAELPPRFPSTS